MFRRLALPFAPTLAICSALVCLTLVARVHDRATTTRSGYIVASS